MAAGIPQDLMKVIDSMLVRNVLPSRGQPYIHACSLDVFKAVCHAAEEASEPFTGEDLVRWTGEPSTQVFTAYAFLKERGILETVRGRKTAPAILGDVYLDGMCEWTASEEDA